MVLQLFLFQSIREQKKCFHYLGVPISLTTSLIPSNMGISSLLQFLHSAFIKTVVNFQTLFRSLFPLMFMESERTQTANCADRKFPLCHHHLHTGFFQTLEVDVMQQMLYFCSIMYKLCPWPFSFQTRARCFSGVFLGSILSYYCELVIYFAMKNQSVIIYSWMLGPAIYASPLNGLKGTQFILTGVSEGE